MARPSAWPDGESWTRTLSRDPWLRERAPVLCWWKSPEEALEDPWRLLRRLLGYGPEKEGRAALAHFGADALLHALESAEVGELPADRWFFWWSEVAPDLPAPPLPRRVLDDQGTTATADPTPWPLSSALAAPVAPAAPAPPAHQPYASEGGELHRAPSGTWAWVVRRGGRELARGAGYPSQASAARDLRAELSLD